MTSSEESCNTCAATAAAEAGAEAGKPAAGEEKVSVNPEPIYVTLNADQEVTEIESLCMNCYKQGTTRLMFLKVCSIIITNTQTRKV